MQLKAVPTGRIGHNKNQMSIISHESGHLENIYDSKLNEPRPQINKSLGKHQINNNLRVFANSIHQKEETKGSIIVQKPQLGIFNYKMQRPA